VKISYIQYFPYTKYSFKKTFYVCTFLNVKFNLKQK
jgi:hypothetical protein